MKDFLGNKLNIGDNIVALCHTRTSSWLKRETIEYFTNCYVGAKSRKYAPDKVVKIDGDNKLNIADQD